MAVSTDVVDAMNATHAVGRIDVVQDGTNGTAVTGTATGVSR